jgi:hypothetical protein
MRNVTTGSTAVGHSCSTLGVRMSKRQNTFQHLNVKQLKYITNLSVILYGVSHFEDSTFVQGRFSTKR